MSVQPAGRDDLGAVVGWLRDLPSAGLVRWLRTGLTGDELGRLVAALPQDRRAALAAAAGTARAARHPPIVGRPVGAGQHRAVRAAPGAAARRAAGPGRPAHTGTAGAVSGPDRPQQAAEPQGNRPDRRVGPCGRRVIAAVATAGRLQRWPTVERFQLKINASPKPGASTKARRSSTRSLTNANSSPCCSTASNRQTSAGAVPLRRAAVRATWSSVLQLGELDRAQAHCITALQFAEDIGDHALTAFVRSTQSVIALLSGNPWQALQYAQEGQRYAKKGAELARLSCGRGPCARQAGRPCGRAEGGRPRQATTPLACINERARSPMNTPTASRVGYLRTTDIAGLLTEKW